MQGPDWLRLDYWNANSYVVIEKYSIIYYLNKNVSKTTKYGMLVINICVRIFKAISLNKKVHVKQRKVPAQRGIRGDPPPCFIPQNHYSLSLMWISFQ